MEQPKVSSEKNTKGKRSLFSGITKNVLVLGITSFFNRS